MIYMESSQLGWEPLVLSWMDSLPDTLQSPDSRSLLRELFHWLLPPALNVLRKQCRVSVACVPEQPRPENVFGKLHTFCVFAGIGIH